MTYSDRAPLYLTACAYNRLFEALERSAHRAILVVFDSRADLKLAVYSNASVVDLQPVLREVDAKLGSGALRQPVARALRWLEDREA